MLRAGVKKRRRAPQKAPGPLTIDGLEIPAKVFTLDGFREWYASLGEGGPRASFLAGSVHLEMTPQRYGSHEPVVQCVNATLRSLARKLDLGRYFFPPSWLTYRRVGLSTEPDGFLVTWDRFEKGLFQIKGDAYEAQGVPTMTFEALSGSSKNKDLVELARLYFMAGVEEYWIADVPEGKLDFKILARASRGFRPQETSRGWVRSPIWKHSFRLRRTTDRAGLPDFVLEHRTK